MGIVQDAFKDVFKKKTNNNTKNDLKKIEELQRLLDEQKNKLNQPKQEEVKEEIGVPLPQFLPTKETPTEEEEVTEEPKEEEVTEITQLNEVLNSFNTRLEAIEQFLIRNFK